MKDRGKPIEAPMSMAKYRELKKTLDAKVASGDMSPEEAARIRKAFGGNLIAHEREQRDASREIGPAIDPMPKPDADS